MTQRELDELDDETWAMFWNDLIWVRKQEKDESLKGLKDIGLI